MIVNPFRPDLIHLMTPRGTNTTTGRQSKTNDAGFANVLTNAFRDVTEMDAADKASALALLTGEADDISGLLIDAQKAELSLNLALQIRNKVVDAYNEIMRMQV